MSNNGIQNSTNHSGIQNSDTWNPLQMSNLESNKRMRVE